MIELAEVGRKIQAQERTEAIVDAMAAAGTMQKAERRQHLRDLERRAYGSTEPERSGAETEAGLAAIGIPVERV